jgi:hypothetical protein
MFENCTTKIQFKFDMGLGDNGKTIVMSKTYDNLKNDFADTSVLLELGDLIKEAVGANQVIETLRIVHEYVM